MTLRYGPKAYAPATPMKPLTPTPSPGENELLMTCVDAAAPETSFSFSVPLGVLLPACK